MTNVSNTLIQEAFSDEMQMVTFDLIQEVLDNHPWILVNISGRRNADISLSNILFLYYMVETNASLTMALWPLTPEEIHFVFTDLGRSFNRWGVD